MTKVNTLDQLNNNIMLNKFKALVKEHSLNVIKVIKHFSFNKEDSFYTTFFYVVG